MIASLLCYTSINFYGANLQKKLAYQACFYGNLHKKLQISRKSTKKGQLRLPQGLVKFVYFSG